MTGNAEPSLSLAVIVLAGGESTRMGDEDKLDLPLGEHTVLETTLAAIHRHAPESDIVLVGPERRISGPFAADGPRIVRAREEPPGGGPVAALRAGVGRLPEPHPALVAVIAGDMPAAGGALPVLTRPFGFADDFVHRPLGATVARAEGALQPLLSVYRTTELLRVLSESPPGALRSARSVLEGTVRRVIDVPAKLSHDVDTPEDLARARAEVERAGTAARHRSRRARHRA